MNVFFADTESLEQFQGRLKNQSCPSCGACGLLTRHGYVRGYVDGLSIIRAWRVFCDPDSAYGKGCGHAPCVRLADTLPGRGLSALSLTLFILALLAGDSVRAAWKACAAALTPRTGYRLRDRLVRCQSVLRTRLSGIGPSPAQGAAATPFLETLAALTRALGSDGTARAYQLRFQYGFLALA